MINTRSSALREVQLHLCTTPSSVPSVSSSDDLFID